jgi:protein-L-isoaspartate(D-aspartate) O-methyltransferase
MTDFAAQRLNMVESQVRTDDVTDAAVIAAMRTVPRELFVPANRRGIAYCDAPIEVAPRRFLLDPRALAKLLQLACLGGGDRVLDVACATGYSTALIAKIAGEVVGLEQDRALAQTASELLAAVGNARIVTGRFVDGYRDGAPYDAIVINGAVETVPQVLLEQLAEGGRLVCVMREHARGRGALYLRKHGRIGQKTAFDAVGPLLPDFRQTVGFVF